MSKILVTLLLTIPLSLAWAEGGKLKRSGVVIDAAPASKTFDRFMLDGLSLQNLNCTVRIIASARPRPVWYIHVLGRDGFGTTLLSEHQVFGRQGAFRSSRDTRIVAATVVDRYQKVGICQKVTWTQGVLRPGGSDEAREAREAREERQKQARCEAEAAKEQAELRQQINREQLKLKRPNLETIDLTPRKKITGD